MDLAFRQSLKRDRGYSDRSRIEIVLNEWLTSSDSITWQEFMRVLREDLEYTEKFLNFLCVVDFEYKIIVSCELLMVAMRGRLHIVYGTYMRVV